LADVFWRESIRARLPKSRIFSKYVLTIIVNSVDNDQMVLIFWVNLVATGHFATSWLNVKDFKAEM
jgi:hypothetical protein